jgi:phosphate transport system substrate-binding protein
MGVRILKLLPPFLLTIGICGLSGSEEKGGSSSNVLDLALAEYVPVPGVSGNLNSIGSDTLSNLMTIWAEGFQAHYPNVNIQIEGKGSSTAPPSLIEGTAQLGPMSRVMKESEIESFTASFGYAPTRVVVAMDALAVYVHKDNPLRRISHGGLDGIYSSTHFTGHPPVENWGDLGLAADWYARPISIYGRNSASGTYGLFKERVLEGGDFNASVQEQPGSSALIWGISTDPFGIGYSGIGYKTSGVKLLELSDGSGGFYFPSYDNVLSGKYPLSRALSVYVNKAPGEPLDALTAEFIRYILSREGQERVLKDGYYPLPAKIAEKILQNLEEEDEG